MILGVNELQALLADVDAAILTTTEEYAEHDGRSERLPNALRHLGNLRLILGSALETAAEGEASLRGAVPLPTA